MLAAPRDRWFLGSGFKRTGPRDVDELVERLLGEHDPRAPLVWHRGFASWTRAEDIPQVERRLAPVLARAAAVEAISRPGGVAPRPDQILPVENGKPGSPVLVYGGLAAGVTALALVGWLLWPRPDTKPAPVIVLPAPRPSPVSTPSPPVAPTGTRFPVPNVPPRAPRAVAGHEGELPAAEVRTLRGVAAWSDETLALTLDNPTPWRVTEIRVRVSRLSGDELVPDAVPLVLRPPLPPVAPGVADLLERVAPDRRKPGLNPLDTGVFEVKAGPVPEGFRWEIESARGYAPL
jgi:hypothetical protein